MGKKWTVTVRQDLKDFFITEDFVFNSKMNKNTFKKMVKSRAYDFEMRYLTKKKEPLSKMDDLHYKKLKMAKYLELEDISATEAKNIFQFRSKMADFKDNYGGTNYEIICNLCLSHTDTQKASFECPSIKKHIDIRGNYNDIMNGKIDKKLAETVTNIINLRKQSRIEAQKCTGIPGAANN